MLYLSARIRLAILSFGGMVFISVLSGIVFAQVPTDVDEEGKIIQDAFAVRKSALPELGWILPNGELVTEVSAPEVTILAEKIKPRVALKIAVIPAAQVAAYVKRNQVDCDRMNEEKPMPLYRYAAQMPISKGVTQVFVLSGRPIGGMQVGYERYKPSQAELRPIWQAMGFVDGQKQVLSSFQQAGSQEFFVLAETYSRDNLLFRQGVFLEDHSGRILGKQVDDIDGEAMCDGCSVPVYEKGRDTSFVPQNLIAIPEMPYPMVLEDSSTVEGRAIELFTFSKSGRMSRYRKYEYMVSCILGADSN